MPEIKKKCSSLGEEVIPARREVIKHTVHGETEDRFSKRLRTVSASYHELWQGTFLLP